jgi:phage tail-like protein
MSIAIYSNPARRVIVGGMIGVALYITLSAGTPIKDAPGGGPPQTIQPDFIRNYRFDLVIDGIIMSYVHTIDGLNTESGIVQYTGSDGFVHTRPGNLKPSQVTITRDWAPSGDWFSWRQEIVHGTLHRKNVVITYYDDQYNVVGKIKLFDAWPSKWSGPSPDSASPTTAHCIEEIVLSFDSIDVKQN